MRRKLIWSLLLGSLAWMQTQAATPEALAALERGRELFDHGRWSDARLEFLKAREGVTPADYHALQSIDYHLAACAVELGSRDAEAALLDFEQRYPGSVFANDVRFSLGSYYCTQSDFERARDCFERTDYKALDRSRREQYDVRMGYVAFTEGRYDQAYDYFDRIGSRSRYIDHARYYKAYIDYAEGRYGRARQGFEQLARSEAYGRGAAPQGVRRRRRPDAERLVPPGRLLPA